MSVDKNVQSVADLILKDFGEGSITVLGKKVDIDIPVVSTGSLILDQALGINGLPYGRVIEIFGPESCLSADTFIPFEVRDSVTDKRINHKGGNIERLYERFHNCNVESQPKQGRHLQRKECKFYVKSANHDDFIVRNEILDVVSTGNKDCFRIDTVNGLFIEATKDHKFCTNEGYKKLSDLAVGDRLIVHNSTRLIGRKKYMSRPTICVKYHPVASVKIVNDKKTNNSYLYYRTSKSRIAYEAYMNGYSFLDFVEILNEQSIDFINSLQFLPKDVHVHHKDENFLNDSIDNLQLVDPSEHGAIHAKDRIKNLSFVINFDEIKSINSVGVKKTYDIKCAYPYNNYVANKFVVHNSGKTTVCLHVVANVQKQGHMCAFVDTEHALDPDYAQKIGVDTDNLLLSQPDHGEQALNIVEKLIQTKKVKCIIVDSVAALTPKAELEGEMGESHMGLHARLMSQASRKLTSAVQNNDVILIFTNQIRSKIGVVYGNPDVTTGGNALKFFSSIRLDVRKRKVELNKSGEPIGHHVTIKVVKNKLAVPFKIAETFIEYGIGFNPVSEVLDLCISNKVIDQRGSFYYLEDRKLGQGKAKVLQLFKDEPELFNKLKNTLFDKPVVVEVEQKKKTAKETVKKKVTKSRGRPKKNVDTPLVKKATVVKNKANSEIDLKDLAVKIRKLKSEIKTFDKKSDEYKDNVALCNRMIKEYKNAKSNSGATSSNK